MEKGGWQYTSSNGTEEGPIKYHRFWGMSPTLFKSSVKKIIKLQYRNLKGCRQSRDTLELN